MHLHLQGGENFFFRRNLQGKCVIAPPRTRSAPQPEQESIFRTVFAGRVRFGGVFRCSLRATTKKGRQLFGKKKCTPRQNPGYAYACR